LNSGDFTTHFAKKDGDELKQVDSIAPGTEKNEKSQWAIE